MKKLSVLFAAAVLFGGFQLFHGGSGESAADEATRSSSFRLVANGDEGACAVTRGVAVSAGVSLLTVDANCRGLMPGIERAKFWRERDDGTVAFSANGIDPIVTFSVADGEGYESYAPASPLLALAATGN